ncbi:ATP-binding cassette domain-containing protein [Yinghuangia aomiensis]
MLFRSVSYTHAGATEAALRDVSFTVERTGLTAIVGPSGAGKTTTLALVDRFLRPASGSVEVLGHDVRDWPLDALRARIAYVDQAFTLLEATARENLQLGRARPARDTELAAALAVVGLADDIARLPQGLDTLLGRESDLSGGQRQLHGPGPGAAVRRGHRPAGRAHEPARRDQRAALPHHRGGPRADPCRDRGRAPPLHGPARRPRDRDERRRGRRRGQPHRTRRPLHAVPRTRHQPGDTAALRAAA